MSKKLERLLLVSLGSPHLETFYFLVKPLFDEVIILSDKNQSYCKTEIIDFRISNPLNALKSIKRIRKIAKEFKPDIVHVHQANSVGLVTGFALKKDFPIVLTTWGSDVLVLPGQHIVKKIIAKKALSYADKVTADASFMTTPILDLCPSASVVIANFGIEVDDSVGIEDIKSKQNIIYSNRLHYPLYRIKDIVEAFSMFVKNDNDWKLIIAGNGELTDELTEVAAKILPKDSYEFVGFIDKTQNYDYYKKAKIWISYPESDGTAVSLLEAMSFGCIPVLSNLPANAEWVNESNGVVVKDNDLLQGINTAAQMNAQDIWMLNAKIIEERASKKGIRELYLNLYKSLLV